MKDLPDDFKISAAILSLGLSYVRPGLDQDEDKKNEQVNVSNTISEESTEEESIGLTENGEHSNEKGTKILCNDYDENIQEAGKKIQVRFGKEELSKTEKSKEENFYKKPKRKKCNELSEKSSEKYVKMFRKKYKIENEVTSKLYKEAQPIYDIGLQKEIINEVRQKVSEKIKSYNNKSISVKEHEEEKKQKFGDYARELIFKLKCKEPCGTDLPRDFFTNVVTLNEQNQDLKIDIKQEFDEEMQLKLNEKVLEELNGEKLQKPEDETVIKMEVDSEFQKEPYSEVEEKLIKEKQPVSVGLEMKADLECQNELGNENISREHKGNEKLSEENNEEDENVQLNLEIEIDPKLKPENLKLQLFIKFEDNSESEDDLDDKILKEFGDEQDIPEVQLKVNECVRVNSEFILSKKIPKKFEGEKCKSVRDEPVESVKKWQQNLNPEKEIQDESNNKSLPSNESKVQEKSNEYFDLQEKQDVSVDIQRTIDEKKQVNSNTEQKLPEKIEKLFEKVHEKFEQLKEDELQKQIDEIEKKFQNLEQEIDIESEKKLIEELTKVTSPVDKVKLLKKYHLSLEQKLTPIEERIEHIVKNYFPPGLVLDRKNDKKKEIEELLQHLEKTVVQNDKVQTELKKKVSSDLDLNCDDVEDEMQEESGNKTEEGPHVEFEGKLDEQLKDSDDNCKEEIPEELDNVRREKSGHEMLKHCSIALEESLKEEKDSDLDVDGTSQKSCEEELDEDLLEDSDIVGEIQEHLEGKLEKVQEDCKRESDDEDSFIDVEGLDEEEIQNEIDTQPVPILFEDSLPNSEEESEEENEEHFGECVDINIVTEVVEDYIVEKRVIDNTVIEERIPTEVYCKLNKCSIEAKELNSSTEELNTLKRKKSINKKVKQNLFMKKQVKFKENAQEVENETQGHNFVKTQQKFKNFVENIPDLEKIPPELKIEQEQIDYKLQQRFREFQEDFYKIFKQEYGKGKKIFNSDSSTFNEQQQTFYELKDEFNKIKEDYKSFVLQKFFEDLQQKIDKENLLGIEELPKELNDNLYPKIDEHIEKEFAKIERDYYELEPEFKYNVPLEFELNNSNKNNKKKLKKKPFNLFDKLHSIHQKKLCEFAKATTWPENCLYPSSVLDLLFEDPSEDKPNFIVITLYPIDIGYSLKISMKLNEPPVEIFFDYATDTILEYIEKEKLPPDLLELFDRAEPRIFYSGCVIVEIHDKVEFTNNRVFRILLRPSNESILRDVNQIIANNSSIDWTLEKRLFLESELIAKSYPVMCLDILPIAGSAVQLQHRLLSSRTISLNPMRQVFETDDLNNDMYSSNLPHEASSNMMDNTSEDIHNILWKFDFRIESIKIIKLYILYSTETQDFSLLLCSNLEFGSDVNMRVKINLKTNQLKPFIFMILEVLKQKIDPVISVFRRYKSDDKSAPRYLSCVTTLLNNKIYEPSHLDISEMIDAFLELKSRKQVDQVTFPKTPIQSDDDDHQGNEKVNHYNVQNSHFFSTNHLSENQYFEMFNMNLSGPNESNSVSEILPTSISGTKVLSSSNQIETKPILSSPLLVTSGSATTTSSALSPTSIPSVSNPVTVISSLPSLINVISSVPSHITVVSSTTSKVSSSEISSIDGILASKMLSTFEDHNVNIDIKLKPITVSKTDHFENLNKNDDYTLNLFDNVEVEHKSPTIYDIMKTTSETNVTQSLNSQNVEKTKVIKHVHGSGICLRKVFPKHTVNMKVVPQKSILLQKNILVEQSTSNSQLDNSINLSKFTDLENSANSEVSTVTRHSSEDVFDEFQRLFGETSSSTKKLKNQSKNGKDK